MQTINRNAVAKSQDVFAFLSLAGVLVFLIWKARAGFGFWDENWYITFGHRFFLGDSMLTDEWNVIQLFSFFLYLPVKLYMLIVGSTDGIILSFRYLFILFQGSVTIGVYLLLRKYGPISIFAVLIVSLYVPVTVMAVSYYSIIASFSVLIGLLLSVVKMNRARLFITGVLFACLVLANPFIALIYLLYLLVFIFFTTRRKIGGTNKLSVEEYFSTKAWFWITCGITGVTVIFVIFLLSGTTLHEILLNLPRLFEDSDYNVSDAYGNKQNIFDFRQSLLEFIQINPYLLSAYAALVSAILIDKSRANHRLHYLTAAACITLIFIVFLACTADFYNYLLCMLPVSLLGLVAYLLSEQKDKKVLCFLWVWGVIIAFFEDIASNQGTKLMSLGLLSSVIASTIFIINIINEINNTDRSKKKVKQTKGESNRKKAAIIIITAVFLVQIGFQIYVNADFDTITAEHFYRDISNMPATEEKLDYTIQSGPAKGLKTVKSSAKIYEDMLADLSYIRDNGNGPLLILGRYPWGYLYAGSPYATYTTAYLIWKLPETMTRLSKYYELHPDKYPEYIYVPKNINLFFTNEMVGRADFSDEVLSYAEEVFKVEKKEGEAGYILRVLD